MLTNCLAACAHLTITVSEIQRDIGRKSSFFIPPLHSTPPLVGSPSEYFHPVWYEKTRMVGFPIGEKNFEDIFNRVDRIPVCDGQTSCHGLVRAMHTRRAVIK